MTLFEGGYSNLLMIREAAVFRRQSEMAFRPKAFPE